MFRSKTRIWMALALVGFAAAVLLWLSGPQPAAPTPGVERAGSALVHESQTEADLRVELPSAERLTQKSPGSSTERSNLQASLVAGPSAFWATVVDAESGAPLSGVQVQANDQQVLTDEEGDFLFEAAKPSLSVFVVSPDHLDQGFTVLPTTAESEPVRLELQPLHRLTLVLVDDQSGLPIEDAQVRTSGKQPSRTGADGQVQVRRTRGKDVSLRADHDDYLPGAWALQEWDPGRDGRLIRLPMTRAARVIGSVHLQDGTPAEGARVLIRHGTPFDSSSEDLSSSLPSLRQLRRRAPQIHTDEEGLFVVLVPPEMNGSALEVTSEGEIFPASAPLPRLARGAEHRVDLTLGLRGTWVGQLVDLDGNQIPGDYQVYTRGTGEFTRAGSFAAQGDLAREELGPGDYDFVVTTPISDHVLVQDVTLLPGVETRVDFVLELESFRLRGRVVNEQGEGQKGLRVTAVPVGETRRLAEVMTASDGRFELDLSGDIDLRLTASAGPLGDETHGAVRIVHSPRAIAQSGGTVELVWAPLPGMRLTFVDASTRQRLDLRIPSFVKVVVWNAQGDWIGQSYVQRDLETAVQSNRGTFLLMVPGGRIGERVSLTAEADGTNYAIALASDLELSRVDDAAPWVEVPLELAANAEIRFEGASELVEAINVDFQVYVATGPASQLAQLLNRSRRPATGGPLDFVDPTLLGGDGIRAESLNSNTHGISIVSKLPAGRHLLVSNDPNIVLEPSYVDLKSGARTVVRIQRLEAK